MTNGLSSVKAIVFDTFGTVVDWRTSIIADLGQWGASQQIQADWSQLVDAWRGRYEPQKERVRRGEIGSWTNIDQSAPRARLAKPSAEFGLSSLSEEQQLHLTRVWHRLNASRPDAVMGLTRLKARYVIGPLSNAKNRSRAARQHGRARASLPWDAIFPASISIATSRTPTHTSAFAGKCTSAQAK